MPRRPLVVVIVVVVALRIDEDCNVLHIDTTQSTSILRPVTSGGDTSANGVASQLIARRDGTN